MIRGEVLQPGDLTRRVLRVVEVAAGPDLEVDGTARRGPGDGAAICGIRHTARDVGQHRPQAPAREVLEEERAMVLRRIRAVHVKREAGDRSPTGPALLAGDDLIAVVVGIEGRRDQARGRPVVEALTDREARTRVARAGSAGAT